MFLGFLEPCVGVLAHGDEIDPNVPVTQASTTRGFEFIIDLLALDAAFDTCTKGIAFRPQLAVPANAREPAWVVFGGCVNRATVLRRGARMRTLPLADLGRASPLVSERLGIFAPIDHFSSDRAGWNAIHAECNIVCYQFAGTPGIQVDDAASCSSMV